MSQLVWTPAAKTDIQKHHDYLYPRNADSADKAVKLILEAGKSLARSPKQGNVESQLVVPPLENDKDLKSHAASSSA